MKKVSLSFCFCLLFMTLLNAQTKETLTPNGESFTTEGVLIKESWSKSTTSYCAGGSDYYMLESNKGSLYLLTTEDANMLKQLSNHVKKNMKLKLVPCTKTFTHDSTNGEMMGQHPNPNPSINTKENNNEFSCEIYKIKEIL
jgi:hypothetical protein